MLNFVLFQAFLVVLAVAVIVFAYVVIDLAESVVASDIVDALVVFVVLVVVVVAVVVVVVEISDRSLSYDHTLLDHAHIFYVN